MHDVIIIGAGPAGLSAALYAGRYRLDTLVLEKMSPGGQIVLSSAIENYPGLPGSTNTFDLINNMKKQSEDLGIDITMEEVLEIVPGNLKNMWIVKTADHAYETKAVIIAVGAQSQRLGVKGEDKLTGLGVSYCGTCDGPLYKNKEVAVIGGGDRAVEEALFLTRYALRVHLIHRRDTLRASAILVEKARREHRINLILNTVVEEIAGEKRFDKLLLKNVNSGVSSELKCHGIFIFVGIKPNTDFLRTLLKTDDKGFIIADQNMHTSESGIFACGDCCQKSFRQVVTACSDGATAAFSVNSYLDNLK